MSRYRRSCVPGACYFFTVVTYHRRPLFQNPEYVALLREAFRQVRARKPFRIDAIVVLPDHLHCLWQLPPEDSDYSSRWREIKKYVSRRVPENDRIMPIWQPRYWEHTVRGDIDWRCHLDYIHYNPVKHGWVAAPKDWPWSSFHALVERGWYESEWATDHAPEVANRPWD